MFIRIMIFLCAIQYISKENQCLKFFDLPSDSDEIKVNNFDVKLHSRVRDVRPRTIKRRAWFEDFAKLLQKHGMVPDLTDESMQSDYIKQKIEVLSNRAMKETIQRFEIVKNINESWKHDTTYQAGYLLSKIRQTRLMTEQWYNLAVKHRDNWEALHHLKIYDFIYQTDLDITHLVTRLVDLYVNDSKTLI